MSTEADPEAAGLVDLSGATTAVDDNDLVDWSTIIKGSAVQPSLAATASKRGEKSFEPLVPGSQYDNDAVGASRDIMYAALSVDKTPEWINDSNTVWIDANMAHIKQPRGKFLASMGRIARDGVCHLEPEEALYLIERGSHVGKDGSGNVLSLQEVYSLLISTNQLADRYLVYSTLKRSGYIVLRPRLAGSDHSILKYAAAAPPPSLWVRMLSNITSWLHISFPYKFACSYFGIFSYLSSRLRPLITASIKPAASTAPPAPAPHPISIFYNVWKPTPNFKKSAPPEPDFRLAIVQGESKFPDIVSLTRVMSAATVEHWDYSRSIDMSNLKDNSARITFAVIDTGIINFTTLSSCSFASEGPVWRDAWSTRLARNRHKPT